MGGLSTPGRVRLSLRRQKVAVLAPLRLAPPRASGSVTDGSAAKQIHADGQPYRKTHREEDHYKAARSSSEGPELPSAEAHTAQVPRGICDQTDSRAGGEGNDPREEPHSVQTFLPYERFVCTALILDPLRLGKQRVEVLQIWNALTRPGHGWRNHPAVRMWRGYEESLLAYGVVIARQWRHLGYADTVLKKLEACLPQGPPRSQRVLRAVGALPPWLGNAAFHHSHRSALVRKDPVWYGRFFPDIPEDLPYVWPVAKD